MSMRRAGVIAVTGGMVLVMLVSVAPTGAQAPAAAPRSGDAVAALVTEVRALRADPAAASARSLQAQMVLGRLQMQEQRLAYLDRQRTEAAAKTFVASQETAGLTGQIERFDRTCPEMREPERRRECESALVMFKEQLGVKHGVEQQLRNQEAVLTDALTQEQARWSDFNSRLDDLERSLRGR